MRSAVNNPFLPGSDQVPPVWAGRVDQLTDWTDRVAPRRAGGLYERGRVLLGEPGIGKSVLVRRIAEDARAQGHLTTEQVRVPLGTDPLPLLAASLLDLADQAGLSTRTEQALTSLLGRVREIAFAGTSVQLDRATGTPAHATVTDLLTTIARDGARDGRVVLVRIDEIQNIDDPGRLSQLLISLGDALAAEATTVDAAGTTHQTSLPVAVYLTGLPEFADTATSRAGATFARRFGTTLLAPLDDDDLRAALLPFVRDGWQVLTDDGPAVVTMTDDAVDALLDRCLGDPYLFQVAGQAAWDVDPAPLITAAHVEAGWRRARDEARRHVERQLDRVPPRERDVLEVMARLPGDERTASRIARELGHDSAARIGSSTQRLDTVRGLIERGTRYRFRVRTVEAYLEGRWP